MQAGIPPSDPPKPPPGETPDSGTADAAKPVAAEAPKPPETGSQPVEPQTIEQQIEGLRAWVAQIDRKLGVRSIAGALAMVLALAAGIIGVVLATSAKDESATKAEVRAISDKVAAFQKQAATAAQDDLATLSDRLDALDARVSTIASSQRTSDSQLNVVQDDIDELRSDVNDAQSSASDAQEAAAEAADAAAAANDNSNN